MLKKTIKTLVNGLGYDIKKLSFVETFFQIDPLFNVLYEEAQRKTQMGSTDNELRRQRHYVLHHLLRNTDLRIGDVCELGCWRGLSAYQMATYLREQDANVALHIFDSFEGLSDIEPEDTYQKEKRDKDSIRKQFACSLGTVQNNLSEFTFIKYYKGWIPERFHEVKDETFSFVHIDVDLYQPTLDSFEFLYPRLAPGGIMVFDDYGCVQFPGAKKAIDECLSKHHNGFFLPLPSGQAFIIKNF
jgi:predicted O-methyltransferase YrrM